MIANEIYDQQHEHLLEKAKLNQDIEYKKKVDVLRNKEVKALLFDSYLRKTDNMKKGYQAIAMFATPC